MGHLVTEPYQVWFPGALVWELWLVDGRRGARLVDTCEDSRRLAFKSGRRRRVLAMPAQSQTASVFVSSAYRGDELLEEARESIGGNFECGIDVEGIGVQPIAGLPPRTISRIDVPSMDEGTIQFNEDFIPDLIVPAASLVSLPRNGVAVWTELRNTVAAVEKDGSTIFYEDVTGSKDIEVARKIREMIFSLRSQKLTIGAREIHLWTQSKQVDQYRKLLSGTVISGFRPDPSNLQVSVGMKPSKYRGNLAKKLARKRRLIKNSLGTLALVSIVAVVCGAYSWVHYQARNQKGDIAVLIPEAKRISVIKSQWDAMASAVDRNESLLETWRSLFNLPTASEIHVRRMEIGKDIVELTCAAPNMEVALSYMDQLANVKSLGSFSWDYSSSGTLLDGTTLFELKGFR